MRFLIQWIKIGAIVVLTALTLVGARSAYSYARESATKPTGAPVTIVISKNESVSDLATDLKARGLITNTNLFRLDVFVMQKAKHIEEGEYTLQKGMSIGQILDRITGNAPPVASSPDDITVRIPEGIRLEQLPSILREAGLTAAAADIVNAAKTGTFTYDFLKDRPQGASLEGYLFPDTYRFASDADANAVIKTMLDNFQKQWQDAISSQPSAQRGKPPAGIGNMYQALIIASIIEREAGSDSDRTDIASVYYNRLKAQPPLPLQADPTVQYAVGVSGNWWKKDLTQQDLDTTSPYNTYPNPANKGGSLPPGPICSPSLKSLQAALNPSNTDYLYFVARNDGSGTHAFAKTLDEHNANIRKYQKTP